MIRHLALATALLATTALAQDDIAVDIIYDTYLITGSSLDELEAAMADNGPEGFWAMTEWYVSWTGDCEITLEAWITMPELDADADLSDDDFAEFDRMWEALDAHELAHVDNGMGFATDVEAAGCNVDVDSMIAPWAEADVQLDADTRHGWTDGVYLGDG